MQLALGKLADYVGARSGGPLSLESEDALPDDLRFLAEYAAAREPESSKVKGVALTDAQVDQAAIPASTGFAVRQRTARS